MCFFFLFLFWGLYPIWKKVGVVWVLKGVNCVRVLVAGGLFVAVVGSVVGWFGSVEGLCFVL